MRKMIAELMMIGSLLLGSGAVSASPFHFYPDTIYARPISGSNMQFVPTPDTYETLFVNGTGTYCVNDNNSTLTFDSLVVSFSSLDQQRAVANNLFVTPQSGSVFCFSSVYSMTDWWCGPEFDLTNYPDGNGGGGAVFDPLSATYKSSFTALSYGGMSLWIDSISGNDSVHIVTWTISNVAMNIVAKKSLAKISYDQSKYLPVSEQVIAYSGANSDTLYVLGMYPMEAVNAIKPVVNQTSAIKSTPQISTFSLTGRNLRTTDSKPSALAAGLTIQSSQSGVIKTISTGTNTEPSIRK